MALPFQLRRILRIALFLALVTLVTAQTAHSALVGHWSFDNTLNDLSGNSNNGTFMGSPLPTFSTDVPSVIGTGQSAAFGGGSGHIRVPDSNSLDITSTMSIAAWVKTVGNIEWDGIVAKSPSDGSGANHAGNYELRIENGTRLPTFLYQHGVAVDDTQLPGLTGTSPILDATWTHVAVTVANGGNANFYVNGAPTGSPAVVGLFGAVNSNPLYIGSRADLFTTMNGFIDDLRIYNTVLTPAEVATLAGGITPPPTPYAKIAGTSARASSQFLGDGRLANNAVNGNGIVGKSHVVNPPGGNMWLTSGADAAPVFEMDLGGVHNVDQLRVWNYNEAADATCCLNRGVKTANVFVAGDNGVYGATPVLTGVTLNKGPGTQTDFSQVISLGGAAARYVKFVVTANYGDGQYTGLSEVNATGTPVFPLAPLPATIQSVSSNLVGFDRKADYVTNRAGMEFANRHSASPEGTMWLSQGTLPGAPADQSPQITFDLGSVKALDRMQVWNYNEFQPNLLGRGISRADILVAGENLVFTPWIQGQEFERALDGGNVADFSQTVDLTGLSARYVRFQILGNYNGRDFTTAGDDGAGNHAGLSEVKFFAAVPEPSSLILACLGLVGLTLLLRRRARP